MLELVWTRGLVVLVAFAAAVAYLWMYWRNPRRYRGHVANFLLYLGMVQVFVYGGASLRLFVFPFFEGIPNWLEAALLFATNIAAMSMTIWVLISYLLVQREHRRLERYFILDRDETTRR